MSSTMELSSFLFLVFRRLASVSLYIYYTILTLFYLNVFSCYLKAKAYSIRVPLPSIIVDVQLHFILIELTNTKKEKGTFSLHKASQTPLPPGITSHHSPANSFIHHQHICCLCSVFSNHFLESTESSLESFQRT